MSKKQYLFFTHRKGRFYEEGLLGKRTLIVGESHHCDKKGKCKFWEQCTSHLTRDSSSFENVCPFSDVPLSQTTIHDLHEHLYNAATVNSYGRFGRFMANRMGFADSERDFYEHIAFVDLLQFFAPKRSIEPSWITERDYRALEETVADLNPGILLLWGVNARDFIKGKDRRPVLKTGINSDYVFLHNVAGRDRLVINSYHPSNMFQQFSEDEERLEEQVTLAFEYLE